MDSGDNFDGQQMQIQDDQMQCDPNYLTSHQTNGFAAPTPFGTPIESTLATAMQQQATIALPPPSSMDTFAAFPKNNNHNNGQPPPHTSTEIDIDSLLLQQFSCLGTTDHEDLVKQFQSLMNNQMNSDSARFFLEMSNWNLQTAVGCYLDFCNFQSLPSMKITQHLRPNEHQQAWRLQNDGTETWPKGCYLMQTGQHCRFEVPPIQPGEYCDIVAEITPEQPETVWRLCTPNGWYFGDSIMIPPVTGFLQPDLADRMAQLCTSNFSSTENIPQINIVISASNVE